MNALVYIIQINGALIIFYLFYLLLLRKDTFLKIRRIYFLTAISFSIIYPFINVPAFADIHFNKNTEKNKIATEDVAFTDLSTEVISEITTYSSTFVINWRAIFMITYNIVTLVFIVRFIFQLTSILCIYKISHEKKFSDVRVRVVNKNVKPFSFFNSIFINPNNHSSHELKQILLHERTHTRQCHSIDTILVEILCIFFWFNPFVWLLKRDIIINLEFIADQSVLKNNSDIQGYQYHLFRLTFPETAVQIVNNFNVSQLKQRIIMMNKPKSPPYKLIKYLMVVPMMFLLIGFSSIYAANNDLSNKTDQSISDPPPVKEETDKVYDVVEEQPKFHNGQNGLLKFLSETIKYPIESLKKGVQGRVITQFVVMKDGTVENIKISRGIDPFLDAEALRVVSMMPKWIPGRINGENVNTRYTLPIVFKLQQDATAKVDSSKNEKEVLLVVEEMPEFPGGNSNMIKFISENIKYPDEAKRNKIQGRVITQFIINKDGTIEDVIIRKGIDPQLDAEALRIVKLMPNWKPAKDKGKVVNVKYTLPIIFSIPE